MCRNSLQYWGLMCMLMSRKQFKNFNGLFQNLVLVRIIVFLFILFMFLSFLEISVCCKQYWQHLKLPCILVTLFASKLEVCGPWQLNPVPILQEFNPYYTHNCSKIFPCGMNIAGHILLCGSSLQSWGYYVFVHE